MDELKAAFLEEAEELFSGVEDILIRAEESGELDDDDINFLFRNIHTLKGGSGSVGFEKFVKIVHIFETFLDKLRNKEVKVNQEIVSFLVDSLSELQEILEAEVDDSIDDEEFEEKYNYIKQKIEEFSSFEDKLDDSTEMLDLLSDLREILDNKNIDEIFRIIHTLKANAEVSGFHTLVKYIHTLEEFIYKIKEGEYKFTNKVLEFFRDEIDNLERLVDMEFNGEALDEGVVIGLKDRIFKLIKNIDDEDDGFELFDEEEDAGFELFDEESDTEKAAEDAGFELFDESENQSEDKGFELFDEADTKSEDKGFELFDEADSSEDKGFELFEDTKQQTKPAPQTKKPAPSPEKTVSTAKPKETQNTKKEPEKPKEQTSQPVAKKPEKKEKDKKKKSLSSLVASSSIRVNLEKIDILMNKVADLVITKSMIYQIADSVEDMFKKLLYERLEILDRNIRELQESVMSIRMVPMESIYAKLPKIIRDISKKVGKKVKFQAYGGNVEIDKLMIEALMDPLTHILRNAIDHGIEPAEERVKAGKPPEGRITISATQESGQIIITIEDDGRGINLEKVVNKAIKNGLIDEEDAKKMSDEEKAMLIFSPGLSTAEKVTDLSGRGVGMDVVMNNITSIGGSIKVKTIPGKGTKFIIILPLTLAILDGLNIRVGKDRFIYPVNMIVESFQPSEDMIQKVSNHEEVLMLRGEFIPVIRLYQFFGIEPDFTDITKGIVIVSKVEDNKYALFIDEFLNQEQIVVKSIEKNYKKVTGVSATTIKGDGSIGLILDIINIAKEYKKVIYASNSV
ncbi:MAG: chemotaxis protein CheA [Epsilonproteobacteria bacterium]|nr:chemotaxis protein CheA [Campylobacterota bacterium]